MMASHSDDSNGSNVTDVDVGTLNLSLPMVQNQNSIDDYLSQPLSMEEKKDLHTDMLSLPPEKLGEICYILKNSQPDQIKEKGEELVIDLKLLDTRTLRHLQRFVQSIYAKVRAGLIVIPPTTQPVIDPSSLGGSNHSGIPGPPPGAPPHPSQMNNQPMIHPSMMKPSLMSNHPSHMLNQSNIHHPSSLPRNNIHDHPHLPPHQQPRSVLPSSSHTSAPRIPYGGGGTTAPAHLAGSMAAAPSSSSLSLSSSKTAAATSAALASSSSVTGITGVSDGRNDTNKLFHPFNQNSGGTISGKPRKRRSSFSEVEKELMTMFWDRYQWKSLHDEELLAVTAAQIGVTVSQLKIFRQNHRKKHANNQHHSNNGGGSATRGAGAGGGLLADSQRNRRRMMTAADRLRYYPTNHPGFGGSIRGVAAPSAAATAAAAHHHPPFPGAPSGMAPMMQGHQQPSTGFSYPTPPTNTAFTYPPRPVPNLMHDAHQSMNLPSVITNQNASKKSDDSMSEHSDMKKNSHSPDDSLAVSSVHASELPTLKQEVDA